MQSVQSVLIQPKYNKIGIDGNYCFTYQVAMFQHMADVFGCLIKYLALTYSIINCWF